MKIISKYKDFYDYMWVDSDPDLVYVRKEKVCFNSIPELDDIRGREIEIGSGSRIDWYYRHLGWIEFVGFTFGIYPFIYTSPAISMRISDTGYVVKCLTKPEVENIKSLKDAMQQSEYVLKLAGEYLKTRENIPNNVQLQLPKYYGLSSPYSSIMRFCWKREIPDVFMKLESPVFAVYCSEIISDIYNDLLTVKSTDTKNERLQLVGNTMVVNATRPKFLTNVCFSKLDVPVTKYWFEELNNMNTYSNIENFLMTSKMDPEPVISNEGRIIAHGFDLKTSFRKM